jgi:ribosome-binding protein aMBF1 (putative translation factor)
MTRVCTDCAHTGRHEIGKALVKASDPYRALVHDPGSSWAQ